MVDHIGLKTPGLARGWSEFGLILRNELHKALMIEKLWLSPALDSILVLSLFNYSLLLPRQPLAYPSHPLPHLAGESPIFLEQPVFPLLKRAPFFIVFHRIQPDLLIDFPISPFPHTARQFRTTSIEIR